jgi:hypothetical protein
VDKGFAGEVLHPTGHLEGEGMESCWGGRRQSSWPLGEINDVFRKLKGFAHSKFLFM